MIHSSRFLAVAGLAFAAALGFVVAASVPPAHADVVPALPVTVPLPPSPVEVPSLPAPPVTVAPTAPDPPPSAPSSDVGSAVGSTVPVSATAARPGGPTSSAAPVAGVRRLADGRISIPIASVVLPNRLVVTSVTTMPRRLVRTSTLLRTTIQVRDLRGYVVRDALVDVRRAGLQAVTLGDVFRTKPDGRVAPALHLGALRLTVGKSLVLVIRAYKRRGFPVGDVATQRRLVVPVTRVR